MTKDLKSQEVSEQEKTEDIKEEGFIECSDTECSELRKKNKTLIAAIILVAGIAAGSFFVDVVQLFSQRGFSAKALQDVQVLEYDGNTWVRYDDPKIVVEVFDADDCEECVTDEVLVRLRSLIPTLEAHRIDVRTEEGLKYAKENEIKHIPAFMFSKEVTESDFYQQAAILFKDNGNGKQYFEAPSVGVPIGEYIETPGSERAVVLGDAEAAVTVVLYDNFTAEESKTAYPIVKKILDEYKDKVNVFVKIVPDADQKNSMKTALAMYCADNQGKYNEYAAVVYTNHKDIVQTDVIDEVLEKYATNLQMDAQSFNKCIANGVSAEKIDENILEASKFGVIAAPTFFIDGKPHIGVITYQGLKDKIDAVLNVDATAADGQ